MFRLTLAAALALTAVAARADPDSAPPTVIKLSAKDMASDPRMIAALRHANASADRKCGEGVGGVVSLEVKAAAQACRRHMVNAAKADAEFEINGN